MDVVSRLILENQMENGKLKMKWKLRLCQAYRGCSLLGVPRGLSKQVGGGDKLRLLHGL